MRFNDVFYGDDVQEAKRQRVVNPKYIGDFVENPDLHFLDNTFPVQSRHAT